MRPTRSSIRAAKLSKLENDLLSLLKEIGSKGKIGLEVSNQDALYRQNLIELLRNRGYIDSRHISGIIGRYPDQKFCVITDDGRKALEDAS